MHAVVRLALAASLLAVAVGAGVAHAQEQPNSPEEWLQRAREAVEEARQVEGAHTPDRPAWSRALSLAERAVQEAPPGSEAELTALSFLASTYGEVHWWIRAWGTWERVRQRTELDAEQAEARRRAGRQLAFAHYQSGALEAALELFDALLEDRPDDVEALRWSGRILLELDRVEEAAQRFERVLEVAPEDAGAARQLELARERARVGRDASVAYRRGLAQYEAGALEEALASFQAAVEAAPEFDEAERWRARLLLETGRSAAAEAAWARIAEADPEDESAAYFVQRARLEQRVGRTAAVAAERAEEAMQADDPAAAFEAWRRAVEAAPDWLEARVGLARAAQALGDADAARSAWREVRARTSEGQALRATAERGLQVAESLDELGPEAGGLYAEAVDHFEQGELEAAEEAFRRASEAAPDAPEVWGWLGRIAFSQEAFERAATYYGRASELAPGDDDYAFFAEQARRMAEEPEPEAAEPGAAQPEEAPEPTPEPGAEEEGPP